MDDLAYFETELLYVVKYIQFRLEKRLNLAFPFRMADLFQDCEIKSYLYFGPDHGFGVSFIG